MIKSFRHKGLKVLFLEGRSPKVERILHRRILRRLEVLNKATHLNDLKAPGFGFHDLEGKLKRYSIHVSGAWCITFEWIDGDAWRVDLEQYH